MTAHHVRPDRPASLSRLALVLNRWRSSHARGSRIPDELWRDAAHLAVEHGVNPVSKTLGLNYYSLKDRVESLAPKSSRSDDPATFVELPMTLTPRPPSRECELEIELESPSGWRIRMRGEGAARLILSDVLQLDGGMLR